MHQSVNGGRLPAQGDAGEFEIEQGDRGIKISRVVRWDHPTARTPVAPRQPAPSSQTFVHPYNFVSVPADGLGHAAGIDPFARRPPSTHDRYDPSLFSGWLQCTLTTKSWWFIPDSRKLACEGEHKILGYFTLDTVDEDAWDAGYPERDATRPAIPASSLRGMVRSVFEAATLSCLSVFDDGVLDLRVGFDPGYVAGGTRVPIGRATPSYVPARVVERRDNDTASIQLLDGRRRGDPNNALPVGLVHAYSPRVKDRSGSVGASTALWTSLAAMADGSPVAAAVDTTPIPHTRRKKDGSSFVAYHYRETHAVVPAEQAATLLVRNGQWLVFGYLHRTGPNIENKHHERIFFRADAPYNAPNARQTVPQRLAAFLQDHAPCTEVHEQALRDADESLRGYVDRHERAERRAPRVPRPINSDAPHLSDFVGRGRVATGDLCYALMEGDHVRGLYPIALPRLAHEDSRGDLLHPDFHPCDPDGADLCLCPACRVFGWVRPVEEGRLPGAGRIDATAGHVRFTHGSLHDSWGAGDQRARTATLAILGSPKPTTTAFYLRPRDDYDRARAGRWPPVLQTAQHENIPLYRREEASLRGRKFFRHRRIVSAETHDPVDGGILHAPGDHGQPARGSQNQTVHLLPSDLTLEFRVHFDNLTSEELGALVFAITLRPPAAWETASELRHALGHGKPLGLGACSVQINTWQIDVLDPRDPMHRYAQAPAFNPERGVAGLDAGNALASHVEAFGRAFLEAETPEPELRHVRESLVEMLRADPPDGPVRYPPDPDGDSAKNYEWFVHNRRAKASRDQPKGMGVLLPDPVDERKPENQLPGDPRERRR